MQQQIVEYIAKALVDHPEAVQVRTIEGDKSLIFELKVDPSDIGKVIGRHGRIARAIRTVLRNVSGPKGKLIHVEILD
ncbi:MAG: KH domain-containing protein [Firmicutes bacterium]|nr:KH domain-containing protein [Bacillota bacterium]